MSISRQEVAYLAKLSALAIWDQESEQLVKELPEIVAYIWQLKEVDTDGVEPLLQVNQGSVSPMYERTDSYSDADWLLENVQHQVNHRNVVIADKKTMTEWE